MQYKISLQQCLDAGFTNAAYTDPKKMEFLQEVRAMCQANRCGRYGKSWSCPPACGTLEELQEKACTFGYGILLQVTRKMADNYDFETIQQAEQACKAALDRLVKMLQPICQRLLPLTAGSCQRCERCTYPDASCRYPDMMMVSMEACGLVVSRECARAGIPYYYGPQTITFTTAVLIDDMPD